jgi:hypothetical protein
MNEKEKRKAHWEKMMKEKRKMKHKEKKEKERKENNGRYIEIKNVEKYGQKEGRKTTHLLKATRI